MTARQTSKDAYWQIEANGRLAKQEADIMRFMHSLPRGCSLSRRALSERSGYPINIVTGRVNTLIRKGWLEELPAEIDPTTGKRAHLLRIKPAQLELAA